MTTLTDLEKFDQALEQGFSKTPFTPETSEALRELIIAAFVQHWGIEQLTNGFEQFFVSFAPLHEPGDVS